KDGGTALATRPLSPTGLTGVAQATFSTALLDVGSHAIVAVYCGDTTKFCAPDTIFYGSSSTNYPLTEIVSPKAITASVTAAGKTYDGNAAATITSCSLSGVLDRDSGHVSCAVGGTSTFDTPSAGVGKTVTATNISLGGTRAFNYSLMSTSDTTLANINPRPETPAVTASNKTYDGSDSAVIASCSLNDVVG